MQIVRSEQLSRFPELAHGFSTREWGNMSYRRDTDGKATDNNRAFLSALDIAHEDVPILDPCLNHGNTVALLKSRHKGYRLVQLKDSEVQSYSIIEPLLAPDRVVCEPYDGIDACWTNEAGICLAMRPADCATIMLYDQVTRSVGMVHAGTIGVLSNIVAHAVECGERWHGIKPRNLHCYVGPSICGAIYDLRKTGLWHRGLKRRINEIQARDYDPKALIRLQLMRCGVPDKRIEICPDCTATRSDLYYSHHAAKSAEERETMGRMLAVIGLRG
jgi:copper oxidase (laccase) domain-containing protein